MTQHVRDVSDVELAKRIKELKGITPTATFEMILKQLVPEDKIQTVERIISGLSQEDEFALLCKMLNCCSSITPLNQTPIVDEDEITPDFQATFHPGSFLSGVSSLDAPAFNCMIEVKSTEKLKFKSSRSDIEKRRRFAARYNLPLLYAIRFTAVKHHAFWVVVSADDLYDKNRIDTSSYVDSLGQLLFDNYSIMVNSSYTLVRRYSKNKAGIGEKHETLGELQSLDLVNGDGKAYRPSSKDSLVLAMLYNIFADTKSYTETHNDESVVYSGFELMRLLTLMDAVYYLNNIISDADGNKYYEPVRAMANLDSPTNPTMIIDRSVVEGVIRRVNEVCHNFFLFGILGDHSGRVNKLIKLMEINGVGSSNEVKAVNLRGR
ncbi:hypothetical protein [Burkholderia stagnalis]|uniref:hypothetical protein n=1 Tax=Burkholderia stagnalis TaxID=1503054 RepID=UPI000B17EBB2|nr:hypothetical protein [Burkholderia stagnalis]